MKGTYASATLVGRVGKDANIFGSGEYQTCGFSLATVSGKGQYERTNWWDIKVIGKGARLEFIRSIALKGARLMVSGELTMREWTDQQGGKRISVEVLARDVLPLDPTDNRQEQRRESSAPEQRRAPPPRQQQFDSDLDDDVPF